MTFQARTDEERKRLNISITEADHTRLQEMAHGAGINQGDVIHLLLELAELVVTTERKRGTFRLHMFNPEKGYASDVESYAFWVAWKLGLATNDQFNEVVNLAAAYKAMPAMPQDSLALIDGFYKVIESNSKVESEAGATE